MALHRPASAGARADYDGVKDPDYRLDDQQKKIWSAAMAGAGMAAPILLRPLMMLQPYKSKLVDVAAIDDKWRVALGPKFFEYPQREREAIVTHECLHATCNQFQRAKNAGFTDQHMLNVAEDLEVNQMVADLQRVRLPDGALMPKGKGIDKRFGIVDVPEGKSMEEYYKMFASGKAECPKKQENDAGDGSRSDGMGQLGQPPSSMEQDIDDLLNAMTPQATVDDREDNDQSTANGQSDKTGEHDATDSPTSAGDDSVSVGSSDAQSDGNAGIPSVIGQSDNQNTDAEDENDSRGRNSQQSASKQDRTSSSDDDGQSEATSGDETADGNGRHRPKTAAESGRDLCGNSDVDKIRNEADKAGVRPIADDMRAEAMSDMAEESSKRMKMNGKAGVSTMDREFLVKFDSLITPPPIPWRRLLQTAMSEYVSKMAYAKTEYSFKRINRRASSYMKDTVFPSMVGYAPIVMMGIDTSGSRTSGGQFEMDMVNAEAILKSVAKLSKNSFSVFSVDTDIKKTKLVNRVDEINFTGGGGTDMSVAFNFVRTLPRRRRPDIFILSTDGGFDWDKCARVWPKNMKVIILMTDHYYMSKIPSWVYEYAKVIEVTPSA